MTHSEKDELFSERQVSDWLGLSEPTLFRHRRDGTGPAFIRLSTRRVAYRRSAVEAWLQARERQALDDPLPARAQPFKIGATNDGRG
jgi:predicted DNA-binding transcriptional regulator AlpA